MKPKPRSHRFTSAFTLLEIMLVVAIIMLLLGTGAYYIVGYFQQSQDTVARAEIKTLGTSLKTYYLNNGFYPTTAQGLNALVSEPTGSPKPARWVRLMDEVKKDPWKQDYVYLCPGKKNPKGFDLYSKGADGIDGNEDDVSDK
ncbi:MAG: type II secretion system major pseudopilin GspG [Verrucomicrobia bacterium]|nr:type II secretion system major pseudopilin GspG [Verrucomicrobiota bacterium]